MNKAGGFSLAEACEVAAFGELSLRVLHAASEWRLAWQEARQYNRPRPQATERLIEAENRLNAAVRDLDAAMSQPKGRVA